MERNHIVLLLLVLSLHVSCGSTGTELLRIGLGTAFGVFGFLVIVFFVSLKIYIDSIKVKPQFVHGVDDSFPEDLNPNKLHNSSIRLRWSVPLSDTQRKIIKIRFFILLVCNRKMAPTSPCMVMIPANCDGSGEHTHEGVLIGDQLTFKVKTVYTPRYLRCFTTEGCYSNTLHFNGKFESIVTS